MPAKVQYAYGIGSDTSTGPSAAIWATCPVLDIIEDPGVGYYYFDDFTSPTVDVTTGDGYTITQSTSGSISHTDLPGGGLLISSGGHSSADDGATVNAGGEIWKPAAGKTLWFEARVKMSDVATTPDQFLVGLTDTDTAPIASGELSVTGENHIVWYTDSGTTAGQIEFATVKAGSADQNSNVNGTVLADDTFVKLGFIVDDVAGNLRVRPFINGQEITSAIVTDTDDIPVTELCLTYVAQCEQTSANAEMTVDWVRIAQLR